MLTLPGSFSFLPLRLDRGSAYFYGSYGEEGSVILPGCSLFAVFAKCSFTLSAMKSLVAWSNVGGNSSNMFLLEGLDVFDCFLIASTAKKSRLLYSLVSNFLLRKEAGCCGARTRFSEWCSSSMPKKEVRSGEYISLCDSGNLVGRRGSVRCCGSSSNFCSECLRFSFF